MISLRSRVIVGLAVCIVFANVASAFDGGNGTANAPYRISTPEHLISIGSNEDLLDKHYIMIADVNMAGYTFTTAVIAPDTIDGDWFNGIPFSGTFNGNGYTIENLTIDKSIYLIGENRNSTIIDGKQIGDVIVVSTNKVTISGFTITGSNLEWGSSPLICAGIYCYSNNVTISNNIIKNNDMGIAIWYNSYKPHNKSCREFYFNNIYNNIIISNKDMGLHINNCYSLTAIKCTNY